MHNPSFATYPQVNPVYNNIQNLTNYKKNNQLNEYNFKNNGSLMNNNNLYSNYPTNYQDYNSQPNNNYYNNQKYKMKPNIKIT